MGYQDSYIYGLRQKVGNMRLVLPSVAIIPISNDSEIKLAYSKQRNEWGFISGYVELNDSWQSAALRELWEESGIEASENDIELFATISGPSVISEYADGTVQSFALIFTCRKWRAESVPTDTEEIADAKWVDFKEATRVSSDPLTKPILDAFQKYLETGKIQYIIKK